MKYPITLVPGGIIPRDPALGIRMQRTPEVQAVAASVSATPTPEPGITMLLQFLASFNGTGDLSGYTADTGEAPTFLYGSGALTRYVRDGAGAVGNLVDGSPNGNGAVTFPIAPPTGVYSFQARVKIVNGDGTGAGFEFSLFDSGTGHYVLDMFMLDAAMGHPGRVIECDVYNAAGVFVLGVDVDQSLPIGVWATIRVDVTATNVVVKQDGVTIITVPLAPGALPDQIGFIILENDGTSTAKVDYLRFEIAA